MKRITLLLIGISLVTINPRVNGWNEASRMALTQSLVEQHSFSIDETVFANTGDKVFVDGRFYSDKPPLPSMLAALVYYPLYHLGLRLDYGWNLSYYLIILLTVKLFWVLSILAFGKALSYTPVKAESVHYLTMIFAFASLMFTWSATFNNHSLAASSLMIAFMFYLKGHNDELGFPFFKSGFFFGLATAMDVPTGIFFLGFGILIFKKWRWGLTTAGFLFAAVIPLSIHLGINYSIGDTLLPLQTVPEFFNYEGSVWADGVQANSGWYSIQYALKSLFGLRGFIWYNPLLFFLVPILYKKAVSETQFRQESRMILVSSVILVGYYFIFTPNYSGWSYSIRWFVPLLPFIYFYLFDVEQFMVNRLTRRGFKTLVIISIFIAVIGLINPWSNPGHHAIPIIANLKQLVEFFI